MVLFSESRLNLFFAFIQPLHLYINPKFLYVNNKIDKINKYIKKINIIFNIKDILRYSIMDNINISKFKKENFHSISVFIILNLLFENIILKIIIYNKLT